MGKKAISILVILFALSYFRCSAQPDSFYGLRLGEVYTQEQIIKAVGDNGAFQGALEHDYNDGSGIEKDIYLFSPAKYNGYFYPSMTIQCSSKTKKLLEVSFVYTDSDGLDTSSLFQEYERMVDDLNAHYPMVHIEMDDPTETRYIYLNAFGTTVRLDKTEENGTISFIQLAFISTLSTAMEIYEQTPSLPEIQDNFFGLTLGHRYTTNQVKNVLGAHGAFLNEARAPHGVEIHFSEVIFAGHKWDFCAVEMATDGRLYTFSVYDSRIDISNERIENKNTFESYKKRLDEKYGIAESHEDESGVYATYVGSNDVAIILSNSQARSKGGSYRLYAKIVYVQTKISNEINSLSDSEL